ncbi:hypothetical protein M501DRAFT_986879 [Patellaria atrata CBS 101060]|uniref:BZIP domain-containing protein n=1 Tax=Patellaria atrata CBS 101060 TaxID=1346257 RepID=A0A9P4S8D5_9PEZI|nr:hypothetical protein M501DRAFT_986879 [Patellaria atrata CBS 101060]
MSQQRDGHAPGPQPSSTSSGGYNRPTTASHVSPSTTHSPVHPFQGNLNREDRMDDRHPVPSVPRNVNGSPRTMNRTSAPSRPGGLESILNPAAADFPEQRGSRRRSAAQMETPSPSEPTPRSLAGPLNRTFNVEPGSQDPSERNNASRKILTPRSPAIHRTQSLGMIRPPTGTIDAHQSPFLSPLNRSYVPEPGMGNIPLLPTPPAAQRTGYHFPLPTAPTQPIHPTSRRASIVQQSASASPATSYSSYGPTAHTSPALLPQGSASTPLGSRYSSHRNTPSAPPPVSMPESAMESPRRYGIPMASNNTTSYQILTVDTQQGPVQLPVDVQAASKVADEKRRRNAGASARFRARRKEKEKEASATISRLEQDVKNALEDADFYRQERDRLAEALYQTPGGDRHFPRPQSPRHTRRVSIATSAAGTGSTSGSVTGPYSDYKDRRGSVDTDRNVRRRTSSYAVSTAQQASSSGQQGYTNPAFSQIAASGSLDQAPHPQGPQPHSYSHSTQHQSSQHPPMLYGPHETSSSAVERLEHEKAWASGQGRGSHR